MKLDFQQLRNFLLVMVIIASFFRTLQAGLKRDLLGVSFVNFEKDEFYLNITSIASALLEDAIECGFACLEMSSCFSYNLAAFPDVNRRRLCELLPSDKYNISDKFNASKKFHHFSIPSPCSSWPCQNSGTCISNYAKKSYVCQCTKGFAGKHCQTDIDECVSGVHDCHSAASCTNTVGSYTCSCNPPYTGDGKTCTHPVPECQNCTSLIGADRKITYSDQSNILCDDTLGPGWFRFQGAAGTRMSTSCTPTSMCSTHGTGWLNGPHPTAADGRVTRQVCFHWESNCCHRTTYIQVRNCSSFYVYHFSGTPECRLRYCGTD